MRLFLGTTGASAAARDAARAFRPLWFQRFDWFLTSEGYLVLCGRDSVSGSFFFAFFFGEGVFFSESDKAGKLTLSQLAGQKKN